jgi:AcrR family transcriptional regulator
MGHRSYDPFSMSDTLSRLLLEEDPQPELSSHERLLLAARHLFSSDGYENATTAAIARRAGTSESQLIKHFGSKEGLLETIFDNAWKKMSGVLRQALERSPTPLDKLRALSEVMIGALESDLELRTLMLLEGRRIRRHGQMLVMTRGYLQLVATIDEILKALQAAGQLRPGLDVQAVRSALIGAIEGMLRDQLLALRMDYPAQFGGRELRAAFQGVLAGFLAPSPPGDGDGRTRPAAPAGSTERQAPTRRRPRAGA